MPVAHILLTILVVAVWGCNFIFIEYSLTEFPPLFLCALRFFLASVPAIFFIKFPAGNFKLIVYYGLIMFGLQFSFIFLGMNTGMTPGLTSLLIQVQIFFCIFFAAIFLGEKPPIWQVIGALVSFIGIGVVAIHLDNTITLLGFIFIMLAAAAWGLGNLISKKITQTKMITLVVWGSFVACFPLLILSLFVEGPHMISHSFQHVSWLGSLSVLYIVYASTWFGYGAWGWLLNRYPVSSVVPFTLLMPVFGMLSSAIMLGEPLQSWKLIAALFVIVGLCINLLGAKLFVRNKVLQQDF